MMAPRVRATSPAPPSKSPPPIDPCALEVHIPNYDTLNGRVCWDDLPPKVEFHTGNILKYADKQLTLREVACAVRAILSQVNEEGPPMEHYAQILLHAFIVDESLWPVAYDVYCQTR